MYKQVEYAPRDDSTVSGLGNVHFLEISCTRYRMINGGELQLLPSCAVSKEKYKTLSH